VPRFLLKTDDNPGGVDKAVFDGMLESVRNDRIAFLGDFFYGFYNLDRNKPEGQELVAFSKWLAWAASPLATQQCIVAFGTTDFRAARLRGHACTPAQCADAGFPAVLIRDSRRRRRLLRERGTGWKFVQYM